MVNMTKYSKLDIFNLYNANIQSDCSLLITFGASNHHKQMKGELARREGVTGVGG